MRVCRVDHLLQSLGRGHALTPLMYANTVLFGTTNFAVVIYLCDELGPPAGERNSSAVVERTWNLRLMF